MARINSKDTIIQTSEQLQDTVDEVSRLMLLIKDEKVQKDLELDELKEQQKTAERRFELNTETILSEIKAKTALCEVYVRQNRKELFHGRAKSTKTVHSKFGFKKPTESLHMNKGVTEENVIQKAIKLGWKKLVKVSFSLVKNEVKKLDEADQRKLGVYTKATEQFYIEPLAESLQETK